jgi:hypothetical protein
MNDPFEKKVRAAAVAGWVAFALRLVGWLAGVVAPASKRGGTKQHHSA